MILEVPPRVSSISMHITNEHYHVYNRGAHKAPIFHDVTDYDRFTQLLYLANDTRKLPAGWSRKPVWVPYTRDTIVSIFAYCLMPNHFHLGLVEKRERGIEEFMRKLCTSYAMYFNKKYDHSGTIFQGGCKSKHVSDNAYLQILVEYIHLNPYGIEEPELMKNAKFDYRKKAHDFSSAYEHSSLKDYLGEKRPQQLLLSPIEVTPR